MSEVRKRRPYHNCSVHRPGCPVHDHPETPTACTCVVYSHPLCTFNYCPNPDECKVYGVGCVNQRERTDNPSTDCEAKGTEAGHTHAAIRREPKHCRLCRAILADDLERWINGREGYEAAIVYRDLVQESIDALRERPDSSSTVWLRYDGEKWRGQHQLPAEATALVKDLRFHATADGIQGCVEEGEEIRRADVRELITDCQRAADEIERLTKRNAELEKIVEPVEVGCPERCRAGGIHKHYAPKVAAEYQP
jgi:hypothetical protein